MSEKDKSIAGVHKVHKDDPEVLKLNKRGEGDTRVDIILETGQWMPSLPDPFLPFFTGGNQTADPNPILTFSFPATFRTSL